MVKSLMNENKTSIEGGEVSSDGSSSVEMFGWFIVVRPIFRNLSRSFLVSFFRERHK